MDYLGIDVGKSDLHAVLLHQEKRSAKSVSNSATGIRQLLAWIKNQKVLDLHVCLESTGGWSEAVGLALHQSGYIVSIVNAARIRAFAQSEMLRTKTDAVDAACIARFCRLHKPEPWNPPSQEVIELQALVRRYQALLDMRIEESNRLGAPLITVDVRASVESVLQHLSEELERTDDAINQLFAKCPALCEQRDLLISIPGIGKATAARILGEMPRIAEFRNVKAVVAFAGLSPKHYQSGTIQRSSRIAKLGSCKLRTALYFPAISALRFNPIVRGLGERLNTRGKPKMSIVAAAMRKLV